MKTGTRLALYGAGLVAAFGGAFGLAGVVVPDTAVAAWTNGTDMNTHSDGHGTGHANAPASVKGLSLSSNGYALSQVTAPGATETPGSLSFQIHDASGTPLAGYTTDHGQDLHLIVVRSDGAQFRHVHPDLDVATGTWSLPWQWSEAGTYRVIADFTPAGANATGLTLTRTVQVGGEFAPVDPQPQRVDEVDGYSVSLEGDLAGATTDLNITVSRNGEPVTTLQPYLGAFGHLVALRQGDLAYLHVHPDGAQPTAGQTGGPTIGFMTAAPTTGRYLLYLDFQVDGQVHTARFVVDTSRTAHAGTTYTDAHSGSH